ncbi:hypothetical protein KZX45_01195 [Georgenia sp. EYE_87]|uniref:hypothetical protein n=1 Tax=Georgenia sp. EYE_87 TaxID=2853448 RepID=UPI00200501BA|nr:hypothetical protein [Georgenia sp. EYE_87]MCK6209158.1 hypothetical protein [Georgenia sp. EYE_87]
MTITVDRRFRGPDDSGNGGYVAGLVAAALGPGPVTVTLRVPPPLDRPLRLTRADDGVRLISDDVLVAEAAPHTGDALPAVSPVPVKVARTTAEHYGGRHQHPFPHCFVCGPARDPGDGLRLEPGRLADGRTACVWSVSANLAGRTELVWAALDCPGGWAAPIEGRPMVLGRMTAQVSATPQAGEDVVVMGELLGQDGRKYFTATTAYGADGRELGRAGATWILLRPGG